jgi:hypothetical protein
MDSNTGYIKTLDDLRAVAILFSYELSCRKRYLVVSIRFFLFSSFLKPGIPWEEKQNSITVIYNQAFSGFKTHF